MAVCSVKTIYNSDFRMVNIEVHSNRFTILFLTVYLPYKCDMYLEYLFFIFQHILLIILSIFTCIF